MQIVPAVRTPITAEQARAHLLAVMPGIDRDTGTLLLALIWIETAGGHLQNHNAGNITANDAWPGSAWRPPWFTVDASSSPRLVQLHEEMLHGKQPSAFRAYESLLDGFRDFARELERQYQSVLAAAKTGDAGTFVRALHDSGYSKDYSQAHVPSMIHLQQTLGPLFAGFPPGRALATGLTGEFVVGLGVAVVAGIVLDKYRHRRRRRAARH